MKRPLSPLLLAALVVLLAPLRPDGLSPPASVAAGRTRTVYVSAFDSRGAPVDDLTSGDFVVKEGGKDRTVLSADPASAPMQVAIIIDDNGTGLFRSSVAQFIQRLLGHGEFAISTVTGQTMRIVDFTTSTSALTAAIGRLGARPSTPDGGQLLEGITEAARAFTKREAHRPVIVVMTVGGEEHSPIQAHEVLDHLRDSGASLHVVSVATSSLRATITPTNPGQMLDTGINLSEVLGDGPKQSGGRRDEIVATTGMVLSPDVDCKAKTILGKQFRGTLRPVHQSGAHLYHKLRCHNP
jgi:hypothetical protein